MLKQLKAVFEIIMRFFFCQYGDKVRKKVMDTNRKIEKAGMNDDI